jgi:retron-type reverse transcriptase
VRRLQVRIAKATQEGRCGKVKALQRLLTRSHSGKMLAVKRVTENRGKRTPGVDGKIWLTPAAKWKGMQSMGHHGYQALPLRRVYIPKSNGKKRPLGIPRMLCRAMQALWKLALEPIAETRADPNSYGFRSERSTADAIAQCFITLAKRASPQWVLEGDIRGCFDNISHEWLLQNIPMDKTVLRRWLQAGYIDEGTLFATEAGTPQGGIATPWTQKITSSLSGRLRCAVRSRYLTCAVKSNMFASYGPIYPVRKGSALERCIRSDRPWLQPQRGRRGVDRAVRFIVAPGVPIPARGAETQASSNRFRADYSVSFRGSSKTRAIAVQA